VNIGDRIRMVRKAVGVSQEEVARRAGTSLKNVGEIERGLVTDPHYSTLRGIAHALGMPVEVLVKEEEPTLPLPV
jgi:transcriptional regulator with XRE-family HTH domain